jgi:LAO/AO transport system kinase
VCEAAGFDVVLVETVGVGQSEVAVADMVDAFLLLLGPGAGDELQGVKRGIVELADLVVVNKADGALADLARHTAADYGHALHLFRPRTDGWSAHVLSCSALEGTGIAEVWDAIDEFMNVTNASGARAQRRGAQARDWMWSEISETLVERLRADAHVRAALDTVEGEVVAGTVSPSTAARSLLERFQAF